jgi:hypothetical protein
MQPETTSALATLAWEARVRAVHSMRGYSAALDFLAASRLPAPIDRVCKAALGAGTIASSSLGTPFEGIEIGPFSDSMRTASAFYRLWSDSALTKIPAMRRIGLVTTAPSATTVSEGASIPLSRVVIGNVVLQPQKCAGLLALSAELLFAVDQGGQAMFSRQLQAVLAAAVDTAFANTITNGVTPITSTGPTKDVRALLSAVNFLGIAKPYFVAGTSIGKLGSSLATYFPAFTAVSATGGELANLPLIISSGLPVDELLLVDGSGIAADADTPEVTVSSEADLQMDTAPTGSSATPTAVSMVSMFGSNSVAVRATAVFAAARLRADAVAAVTGITSTTWAA